jgi:hypothetical protein
MTTTIRRRPRTTTEPRITVDHDPINGEVRLIVREPETPGRYVIHWLTTAEATDLADALDEVLAPDCDTCPPGRPCACTADSIDPLDH